MTKNQKGLNKALDKAHSQQFNKNGVAKDHPSALKKFEKAMEWIGTAALDIIPGMEEVGAGLTVGRLAAEGIEQGASAGAKAAAKQGAKKAAEQAAKKGAKKGAKEAGKQLENNNGQQPPPPRNYKAETQQEKQQAQDNRNSDMQQYQQMAQQVNGGKPVPQKMKRDALAEPDPDAWADPNASADPDASAEMYIGDMIDIELEAQHPWF